MRRYLKPANVVEIWMRLPVEAIRKQRFNFRPAELPRRQADSMHDNELRLAAIRASVTVAARYLAGRAYQTAGVINA